MSRTPRQDKVTEMKGKMVRVNAMAVDCPYCGAKPGWLCFGKRTPVNYRKTPHVERYEAAVVPAGWKLG